MEAEKKRREDVSIPESEQTVGNICLICKRQFVFMETLKKHLAESERHKVGFSHLRFT